MERMGTRWTRERLIERVDAGGAVEFVFFWQATSYLSQWFPCAFDVEGVRYASAEHFMMAAKARLFGDREALADVLAAPSPAEAKAIGRRVRGYDEARWAAARFDAVVRGNVAKFAQHHEIGALLDATEPRVLVEASPHDRVWGIGLDASDPDASDPRRWRGQNLLGFALTTVRELRSRST